MARSTSTPAGIAEQASAILILTRRGIVGCGEGVGGGLKEYLDGIRVPTRRATSGTGTRRRIHHYRWMSDLPLRDGDDALRVNWFQITSARPGRTVTEYHTFPDWNALMGLLAHGSPAAQPP